VSGPLPGFLSPLTVPASWAYRLVIDARNRRYDRGIGIEKLPVPVISVGNITTGGTGKTPLVMWICERLRRRGRRPAIAMRGYGPGTDQGSSSDEAMEYADRLSDVPVVANPDRVGALRAFLPEHPEVDCVVLDDGFQHRRLHRELDLVLIDATARTFTEALLPAGHLREPLTNLARADALIVTRAEQYDPVVASLIEQNHGRAPLAWSRHAWTWLAAHSAANEERLPVSWLRGRRLVAMLGVGNPEAIIAQIESAGAAVAAVVPARDHERFGPAKLELARTLADDSDGLVMTAKDWVRSRGVIDLRRWRSPIIVPELAIEVFQGSDALEELLADATEPDRRAAAGCHSAATSF
jgi:tetraacyldisaccharide 4'-kinase